MSSKLRISLIALLFFFASAPAKAQIPASNTSATASAVSTPSLDSKACGSSYLGNGKCGWVSGGSTRSTSSILWTCFAVILLCTYKVIRLNICSEAEHTASWKEWSFYRKRLRKLAWMLGAILAPEYISGVAYEDWRDAAFVRSELGEMNYHCSLLFSHFVLMGGLATETSEGMVLIEWNDLKSLLQTNQRAELVKQFPSDLDILDRSKTDSFTTVLACVQCLWLVLQCVGRAAGGAEISELELTTCSFVLCSIVSYAFWWNKPCDIEHRSVIQIPESIEPYLLERLNDRHRSTDYRSDRIRSSAHTANSSTPFYLLIGLGILLSAVHLAAWNWSFPSFAELYLWRVSCLLLVSSCVLFSPLKRFDHDWVNVLGLVQFFVYCVARPVLIIQVCLCFRKMPEGVYTEVTWSQWERYLPHLS